MHGAYWVENATALGGKAALAARTTIDPVAPQADLFHSNPRGCLEAPKRLSLHHRGQADSPLDEFRPSSAPVSRCEECALMDGLQFYFILSRNDWRPPVSGMRLP